MARAHDVPYIEMYTSDGQRIKSSGSDGGTLKVATHVHEQRARKGHLPHPDTLSPPFKTLSTPFPLALLCTNSPLVTALVLL